MKRSRLASGLLSGFSAFFLATVFLATAANGPSVNITLATATSPTEGQAGMGTVNVTGFGVPAGTITPSQVTITLQPGPGVPGNPVITTAQSVLTVVGTTRRFVYAIPTSIVVSSQEAYLVSVSGIAGTTSFASTNTANLTIDPPASLNPVSTGFASPGATFTESISGNFTHFLQGGTAVTAGAGITVSNIVVASPTALSAQFSINAAASPGPRTITVTTGNEAPTALFTILAPVIASVNPASGQQGQVLNGVQITGQGTHFTSGTPAVSFSNVGVAASNVVVTDDTHLTATLTIAATAATGLAGLSNVTVTTGTEVATGIGLFTVNPGTPVVTSVNPANGQLGQVLNNAVITGNFTHFTNSSTVAFSNPNVVASNISAVDATHLSATLTIAANATVGPSNVTVTTGAEVATGTGLFTVNLLTSVNPASGKQGQVLNGVVITGNSTHFTNASVVTFSSAGITPSNISAIDALHLSVTLTIAANATLGPSNLAVTTGLEVANGNGLFTVNPGTPAVTNVNPASGQQGQVLNGVVITGSSTHFTNASTVAFSSTGITVSNISATDATHLSVTLTIAGTATTGLSNVTVTTGAEVASGTGLFTVTPGAVVASVNPASGQQGQVLNGAVITGNFTHFTNASTVAFSSTGITVSNISATDATHLSVTLTIAASATLGLSNVTVTTGAEVAAGANLFTVGNAPVLSAVNPNNGQQGQVLNGVVITGNFTHFTNASTVAFSSTGITVSNISATDATHLSVTLTLAANATLGLSNVTVTTGAEVANGTGLFTVNPRPVVSSVNPASGQQGQVLNGVVITGSSTHFTNASTVAFSSTGITVSNISATDATHLSVTLTIAGTATTGLSNVTVTTGAEVASGTGLFTVTPGAVVASVNPASGQQGQVLNGAVITGNFTHFTNASTVAFSSTGITVSNISATDATHLSVTLTIAASATLGLSNVTVTTGAEVAAGANLFTVGNAPVLSAVNPNNGQQGQVLNGVVITGNFTHFTNASTVAFSSTGITVSNISATDATHLSVTLTLAANATLGLSNVTVTTGAEVATGTGLFTVNPRPVVSSVNPASGQQGQVLNGVVITGSSTHFTNASTVAFSSTGITVSNISATDATHLSVTLTIAGTATTGLSNVTVTTGAEVASGTGLFTVTPGAVVASVNPASGQQGQVLNGAVITGNFTHFTNASTVAFSSSGITVSNISATDATHLSVTLTLAANATLGLSNVTVTTGAEVANGTGLFTVNPRPVVSSVNPASGQQGQVLNGVVITGSSTHFTNASTVAFSSTGITVSNISATDATHLSVTLTIAASATLGLSNVTVTTGAEVAAGANLFTVGNAPVLSAVNPNNGQQGQVLNGVVITGNFTHFTNASTVAFSSTGITVSNISATDATHLSVTLTIAASATLGLSNVTVTTGAEVAAGANLFTVGNAPVLSAVNPNNGQQGQVLNGVVITGNFTHFTNASAVAFSSTGITVSNISATDATHLSVTLTLAANATLGLSNVTVTTGAEVATGTGLFTVNPRPVVSSVNPASGQQGQVLNGVVITGSSTHFTNASTVAFSSTGITVSNISATDATHLSVTLTIAGTATTGLSNVTVTTGAEVASGTGLFTVTPGAVVASVNPASGQQGQVLNGAVITGNFTHFTNASTVAFSSTGITVSNISATDATHLSVTLTIAASATLGLSNVTVTTGAEVAAGANLFTVGNAPVLSAVNPNNGQQGQVLNGVVITGNFTHFTNASTVAFSSTGITVSNISATDATHLSVTLTLAANATLGLSNVTVTTGAEVANGTGLFTVNPRPVVSSVNPASGQQGQVLNGVAITGNFTHFTNASAVAFSSTGIAASNISATNATHLSVTLTLAANATTGLSNVTVTTGAEVASGTGLFTINTGASTITATTGTPQTATVNSNYTTAFQATVLDAGSHPLSGIMVTFTAPASGPSGNFSGQPTATVATNSNGIATAPTFSANTKAGSFTLTATAPGASNNPANFSLKNLPGPANIISVNSGSGQSAVVNVAYSNPLVGLVTDAFQNPVSGVSVTFNSPASSGPSVVFTGSTTVVTDVNGLATSTAFSANTHAGPANTTATSGSLTAVSFTLTNLPGTATTITPLTGSGQSAQTNAAFTNPLVAQVSDQFGNGISGLSVTFTAPSSGASGNFPGPSPTASVSTGANGTATSPTIAANGTAGSYTVAATVTGVTSPANFSLTNNGPAITNLNPSVVTQGQNTTIIITGNSQTSFVQGVTTASFGNSIGAGTVTVNGPSLASVPINVGVGAATGPRTITVTTGTQILQATFNVMAGAPIIQTIQPNAGIQNQTLSGVVITGAFTHFDSTTTASFGAGIQVGGNPAGQPGPVTLNGSNQIVANLVIGASAANGPRNVIINTPDAPGGAETLTVNGGFTVGNPGTSPTVVSISPASGATGVPLDTQITVQFDRPIDRTTVTTSDFELQDDSTGQLIPGTITVDATGRIATFSPSQLLGVSRNFLVILQNPIADSFGNTLTVFESGFTTGFTTDITGPALVDISPRNADTNVPLNVPIVMEFNKAINPITQPLGILVQTGGVAVPGMFTFQNLNAQVTFTPNSLAASTVYTITLNNQLTDAAGNPLSNPSTIAFTTGTANDTTGPVVLSFDPISGDTGVGLNAVMRVRFNKIVDPLTITPTNFLFFDSNIGQVLPATITVAADRMSATLTPTTPLLSQTNYTFEIFSYTDLAGNNGQTVSSQFTTGSSAITTPATVILASPTPGATGVPTNTQVAVQSIRALDPTSITSTSIHLSPAAAGTATISADLMTVTFMPTNPLTANTTYTVTVSGIVDAEGNAVSPLTSNNTFKTGATTDTTPGTVVMTTPTNGATSVPVNQAVVLTFSKPVNPATVGINSVQLFDNQFGQLASTIAVSGNLVTLTPVSQYRANATIIVQSSFSSSVTDFAGNAFPFLSDSFVTANTADTTPPTVTSVTPINGSTGLGQNTQVVLTFSKSLNPNTVNASNFAIFNGSTQIGGGPQLSSDIRTVVINPGTLAGSSTFTVVVTSAVTDLSGNHLANFSSQFSTAPAPQTNAPSVQSQIPANGATGVPVNAVVTLYMNKPVNPSTVTTGTSGTGSFLVSQNGILVAGSVQVIGNGQTLQFTPSGPFTLGALVQVFLTTAVQDSFGNPLGGEYAGQFTVVPNLTGVNPTLVTFNPPNGSFIPLNQVFELQFSKPMDGTSANLNNVQLLLNNSTAVASTVTLVGGGTIARLVPNATLTASTEYCIFIPGSTMKDTTGLLFLNGTNFCLETGTTTDTLPPSVTSVAPPDTSTGIGENAVIRITFNKPVNPMTVNASTVQLTGGGFTLTPASISTPDNLNFTIAPQAALPPNTLMTLTINGVEDLVGNTMIAAHTTTFTTSNGADFNGPTVLSASPLNGLANVPVNALIVFQFNKQIDPRSITSSNFYLQDNVLGTLLAGSISFSPDLTTVTFLPAANLAVGRNYNAQVFNYQDLTGNIGQQGSTNFRASFAPNSVGPVVTFTSPGNGATGVPINSVVQIGFSEPVDGSSVGQMQLLENGSPMTITRTLSNGNQTLTLTPNALFAQSAPHSISITGVRDTSGNAQSAISPQTFTTGTGIDVTAGTVISSDPVSGATGVGLNAVIRVRFSKIVNPLSITAANFDLLFPSTGQILPATVSVSADRLSATLTPNAPLLPETTYRYAIFSWTDLAGNSGSGVDNQFTTGSSTVNTPATVTLASPTPGATGVPTNTQVAVQASRPIDPTSITSGSIQLSPSAAGTATVSTDAMTVTFTPTNPLTANTTYTVTVSGIVDAEGNAVSPLTSNNTFKTGATADTTPGTVVMTTPNNGATSVPVNQAVVLTFSNPVNPSTVNINSVQLFDNQFGQLASTIAVSGNLVTLTPVSQYRANATIIVQSSFSSSVTDFAGNVFPFLSDSFVTANTADTTPPTVTSVTPTNGSTGLGQNTQVVLTFSKSLNPSTVSSNSFAIFNGSTQIGGGPSLSSDNRTAVINSGVLPGSATITVVVTTAVTDLSGNHLATEFSSSFTTAAVVQANQLTVQSQIPANGATGVPANSVVTLFVSSAVKSSSVTSSSFVVSENGVIKTGSILVTGSGQVLQFTASAPFANSALVQVFLTTAVTDSAGNPLNGQYAGQFTVVPNLTAVNPTVVNFNPNGSTIIPLNQVFELQFSKPMDGTSANLNNVQLLLNNSTAVASTVTLVGGGTIVRLVPTATLTASSLYCIFIPGSTMKDTTGLLFLNGSNFCLSSGTTSDTLPPTVTGVAPPNTATGIGVNAIIRITFSKVVNPITVNASTVQLSGGSFTLMPASISSSDNINFTIAPQSTLPVSTLMTLTINGVEDAAGNIMASSHVTTFTTSSSADFVAPTGLSTSPANTATNVPVNAVIVFQFSKQIDPRSINSSNFIVTNETLGTTVSGTISFSSDLTFLTFAPSANLAAGDFFIAELFSYQDLAGNVGSFGEVTFTASSATDNVAPTVLTTSPLNGLSNVPINAQVQILFSEPIQPSSLGQVQLLQNGSPMVVTQTLSNGNQTLTLTPNALFAQGLAHSIKITGVKDVAGNVLSGTVTATFTTGSSADLSQNLPAPTFSPTSTGVSVSIHPTVTFSQPVNPVSAFAGGVVLLLTSNSTVVPATFSISADGLTVSIIPNSPLAATTQYTIINFFAAATTDLAGNGFPFATANFTTQ